MSILPDKDLQAYRRQAFFSGLGNLGGGLMAAAFGNPQGLMSGMQGFNQATDPTALMRMQLMEQQLKSAQMDQTIKQQQLAQAEKTRAAWKSLFNRPSQYAAMAAGGGPTPAAAGLMSAPGGLMANMTPEQMQFLQAVGPTAGMKILGDQMFAEPKTATDIEGYRRYTTGPKTGERVFPGAKKQYDPKTAAGFYLDESGQWQPIPGYEESAIRKAQAGAPQITIDQRRERAQAAAEGAEVGGFYGKDFTSMLESGRSAMAQNQQMDILQNLFEQTYTGTGGEQVLAAKKLASALGVEGLEKEIASGEAGQAIANELALQLRNPAGGAGMPGSLSDSDRAFLQSMTGGLSMTQEGRAMLFEAKRRVNARTMEIAAEARRYRQQKGALDSGFYDLIAQKYANNPAADLFADMRAPSDLSSMSTEDLTRELMESLAQ